VFIEVTELMIASWNGNDAVYAETKMMLNPSRIVSIRQDKLHKRDCTGIVLDNACIYVSDTIDDILRMIPE